MVGTPDYIPPEVISGESMSNNTIDWWSLGVILYEFVVGLPPFNDNTVDLIFSHIRNREIDWPEIGKNFVINYISTVINAGYEEDMMTPDCKDLIDQLLNMNYKTRLGANGA